MSEAIQILKQADKHIDYDSFLEEPFDTDRYVEKTIHRLEADDNTALTVAIQELTYSMDSINKQIHTQVTENHEQLLEQVTDIKDLNNLLSLAQSSVDDLNTSLSRLRAKIREPYDLLKTLSVQLGNLQQASDLLRKLHRFLLLARRLEIQLPENDEDISGKDVSAAAITLRELDIITEKVDFREIHIAAQELLYVERCKSMVEEYANRLLEEGISSHKEDKLDASLQVYYNLNKLSTRIKIVIEHMLDDLKKEINIVMNKSNNNGSMRPEPIWTLLDDLFKKLGNAFIQIQVLEKVLDNKKDPYMQSSFMDHVTQALDSDNLVWYFWGAISSTLKEAVNEIASFSPSSSLPLLATEYPKLLRILQQSCFVPISMHVPSLVDFSQSREYVVIRNSFSSFENTYLERVFAKIRKETLDIFPSLQDNSIYKLSRTIDYELASASAEPLLLQSVAKKSSDAMRIFVSRCESMVPLENADIFNPSKSEGYLNTVIKLINGLYTMHRSIWKILDDSHADYNEKIIELVSQGAEKCRQLLQTIGHDKLLDFIKLDSSRVILRVHDDFSSMRKYNVSSSHNNSVTSYMKDLKRRLQYYHSRILSRLSCGSEPKTWSIHVCKYILWVFVFQASMISPLNEENKLKLAGDMAEIEFSVNQLVSEHKARITDVGEEYDALRSFRQLLFSDATPSLSDHKISGISGVMLMHNLVVRSQSSSAPLTFPHISLRLSRLEYMHRVEKLDDKGIQDLFDNVINGLTPSLS